MSFYSTSCVGGAYLWRKYVTGVHGGFYCIVWGQLEGKLRLEGCQGVSTAAVLRQTCSKLKLDSGSSSETPMIPMAYSFEPIQVALQRLSVMILTWVKLQPAAMHLQTILPPTSV